MKAGNSHIDQHAPLDLETILRFKRGEHSGEAAADIERQIQRSALYTDVSDGLDDTRVHDARSLAARLNARVEGRVGQLGRPSFIRRNWLSLAGVIVITITLLLWLVDFNTNRNTSTRNASEVAASDQAQESIESTEIEGQRAEGEVQRVEKEGLNTELDEQKAESEKQESGIVSQESEVKSQELGMDNSESGTESSEAKEESDPKEDLRKKLLWNSKGTTGEVQGTKSTTSSTESATLLGSNTKTTVIRAHSVHVEFKENLHEYEGGGQVDYSMNEMPGYPGGDDKMIEDLKYFVSEVTLPAGTKQQASVSTILTIDSKGHIENIEFVNDVSPEVKEKITSSIKKLDPWSRGKKTGKRGSVVYGIAVSFR